MKLKCNVAIQKLIQPVCVHNVHVLRLLSKSRISVSYLVTYVWFNMSLVVIGKEQSWVSSHEIINSLLAESHLSFTMSDMSQKGELCTGKGTLIKKSFIHFAS